MSAALSRHRLVLRAAVATAALTGAVLTPAVAFAADGQSGTPATGTAAHCTVTKTIGSVFGGWTVDLTNSLSAGPKAVLKDDKGATVGTVDRAHPEDLAHGMKIKNAESTSPVFLDRNQGGDFPWRQTPFPALPQDCVQTGTGTGTGSGGGTGSGSGTGTGTGTASGLGPGTGPITVIGKCTVLQTIPSRFGGWTVDLTNSLSAGPKAVLKNGKGQAVSTVDRNRLEDTANGLKIKNAYSTSPVFLDNNQGGDSPWRETPFPKLPKGCVNTGTGKDTSKPTGSGSGTGSSKGTAPTTQTKVVPAGGVAAGAEGAGGGEQNTTLLAGGVAVAAAGVIGLGYVVRRRRAGASA